MTLRLLTELGLLDDDALLGESMVTQQQHMTNNIHKTGDHLHSTSSVRGIESLKKLRALVIDSRLFVGGVKSVSIVPHHRSDSLVAVSLHGATDDREQARADLHNLQSGAYKLVAVRSALTPDVIEFDYSADTHTGNAADDVRDVFGGKSD